MTKTDEYTQSVENQCYPNTPRVPLDHVFADQRGEIHNLLLTPITSVAEINSNRGAVRANHYHKTDWHYTYVVDGEVLYFERPIGVASIPEPHVFVAGEMFFTPPMVEHAMLFREQSRIITFARNVRSHDNHEADLVRVEFVTPAVVDRYLP